MYFIAVAIAAVTFLLVALRWPAFGSVVLRGAERRLYLFAKRRWLAVVSIASLAIVGSAAIALATRIPQPQISDEFGHLLAADTFASGRLSNPTHPMWIHFETPQVIQRPTYVSKYPPAQGMILAVGQILTGQPIVGVWLSAGLACGAICWMLQGWFRPGVALAGALFALYRLGITTYWSHSYWGGMMAALGSALVFGALKRVSLRPLVRTSIVLGVGLAILANSRPYEGLLATVPVFAVLLYRCWGKRSPERAIVLRRIVTPVCAVGFLTLVWMGYYNFRQTGNAFINAYQVYTNTYQVQPIFAWQTFRPPPRSDHPVMFQNEIRGKLNPAQYERSIRSNAPPFYRRLSGLWAFYCHIALTTPFLVAFVAGPSLVWCAIASLILVLAGLLVGSLWIFPHYAAPITGPFFIVVTYGWSRLRAYRIRRQRTGLFLARMILAVCVILLATRTVTGCLGIKQDTQHGALVALLTYLLSAQPPVAAEWPYQRAAIEQQLEHAGGTHLILVRYRQNVYPDEEWVDNKADIDRAAVVWARELDREDNRKLIEYFRNRHVWLLEADQPSPRLVPYPLIADGAHESNATR